MVVAGAVFQHIGFNDEAVARDVLRAGLDPTEDLDKLRVAPAQFEHAHLEDIAVTREDHRHPPKLLQRVPVYGHGHRSLSRVHIRFEMHPGAPVSVGVGYHRPGSRNMPAGHHRRDIREFTVRHSMLM